MKYIIAVLVTACLCGCSLVRKRETAMSSAQVTAGQVTNLSSSDLDTSKRTMTERIRFTFPGNATSYFEAPAMPQPSDLGISGLSKAALALQSEVRNMLEKYKGTKRSDQDLGGLVSKFNQALANFTQAAALANSKQITLEIERNFKEQAYRSSNDSKRDSLAIQHKSEQTAKSVRSINPLLIILMAAVCLAVILVVFFLYRKYVKRI